MSFHRLDIVRHALVLFTGHIMARLLTVAGLALMLTSSEPESIGLLGVWVSSGLIISILVSGRLELPMVSADKQDAATLFAASLWLAAAGSALVGLLLFLAAGYWWSFLFAAALFLRAFERILLFWATRLKLFKVQSRAVVINSALRNGSFAVLAAGGMLHGWNLVFADLLSLVGSVGFIFWVLPRPAPDALARWRAVIDRTMLKNAFYNGFAALAEAAALYAPTTITGYYFGLAMAGHFHIASRLGDTVRTLVVASTSSPVFNSLGRAARRNDRDAFIRRYRDSFKMVSLFSIAAFGLLVIALFAGTMLPFMSKWQEALGLALYMIPAYLGLAVTGPLYRLFSVLKMEYTGFIINLVWGTVVIAGFLVAAVLGNLTIGVVIFGVASIIRLIFVVFWQKRHINTG